MKNEEILAKAQAEGKDEYEESVNLKSGYWGIMTLLAVCIFFTATKVLNNGQPFFEFPAILFAYLFGMHFYNYKKLKKATYLTTSFSFFFAFICMTILYFINM